MQTLLPYSSFKASAEALDKKRCWKQALEAWQILNVLKRSKDATPLERKKIAWANHPAVRMWRGYENTLKLYFNCFLDVSIEKWGVKSEKLKRFDFSFDLTYLMPRWVGYEPFHAAHRGNLIRKDFEYYYVNFGWTESPKLEYLWPVDIDGKLDPKIEEYYENSEKKFFTSAVGSAVPNQSGSG